MTKQRRNWKSGFLAHSWARIWLIGLLLFPMPAPAVEPNEILPDATLESRARKLSAELRCLVCQNQSIDDSNAPLARDLRLLVRERLAAGDSDGDVKRFLVARYGEFVLLNPPLGWHTVALWLAPVLALLAAATVLWLSMRHGIGAAASGPAALSKDEETEIERVLDTPQGQSPSANSPQNGFQDGSGVKRM